jgi:nicotinamidase-related amidase
MRPRENRCASRACAPGGTPYIGGMNPILTRLDRDNTCVLIVDLQEKLLPAMHDGAACLAAARRLLEGARLLGLPILATEQYPAGLGPTCPEVRGAWEDVAPVEKTRFSACVEPLIEQLRATGRSQVVVAGVEAHVCVQLTVLDLLRLGFRPVVCADAITSRRVPDCQTAIERMRQAGAIVTTVESVLFEMLGEAGGDAFKSLLKIVK